MRMGCRVFESGGTAFAYFVEREEGVSVDLCAEVSRHVSDLLDVEEIMPSAYTLEVSLTGLTIAVSRRAIPSACG